MELKPMKAQILWLAEKYNTVPLSTTLPATVTPTQVLQKLKTVSRHCYMLESCEDKESSGRYTFLGFDPQAEIHCKDGKGTVIDENGSPLPAVQSPILLPCWSGTKAPDCGSCPPLPAGWWATLPTTMPNTASRGWS